jgi:hypothetical protein
MFVIVYLESDDNIKPYKANIWHDFGYPDFKNLLASGIDSFSSGRTKTFFLFFSNPIHQVLPTFLNPTIPGNLHLPTLPTKPYPTWRSFTMRSSSSRRFRRQ